MRNPTKGSVAIIILIVVIILVAGYFVYTGYSAGNKKIEVVEKIGTFSAIEVGRGIGDFAVCPEGKKAISGSCGSVSDPQNFLISGSSLWKSRQNLEYENAWMCEFNAAKKGEFTYRVSANCQ